jgi:hypothetical protein
MAQESSWVFSPIAFADSGESLSALWIARYPGSGNERKRVLGVLRALWGLSVAG